MQSPISTAEKSPTGSPADAFLQEAGRVQRAERVAAGERLARAARLTASRGRSDLGSVVFGARAASLLLLLALVPLGCDQRAIFETMIPQQEAAVAREVVARIAAGDLATVEAQLAPELRTPDARFKLQEIARVVPAGEPLDVQTVGAHTVRGPAGTTYNLTLEYRYPESWLIANVVLAASDGGFTLNALHLTPRSQSLEAENAFTFAGKGPMHFVVLALAVLVPLFILFALAMCVRTTLPRRKWLWLAFVAIGLVQFQFNWSTGAWLVRPFAFSILGAGAMKAGPVAPWVITIAFPLGAVLFLIRRRFGRHVAPATVVAALLLHT